MSFNVNNVNNNNTETHPTKGGEIVRWEDFKRIHWDGQISGLPHSLIAGVYRRGFDNVALTQQRLLPFMLDRELNSETKKYETYDLIAQAQSGTGKTATFAIGMLSNIELTYDSPARPYYIRGLVLAPTRELASQIYDNFVELGSLTNIKSMCATGGKPVYEDKKLLSGGIDILIGTPGRITDLIERKFVRGDELVSIVLDEADKILNPDEGFYDNLGRIFSDQTNIPENCQFCVFSSTYSSQILQLIEEKSFLRANAKKSLVESHDLPLQGVKQFWIDVEEPYKIETLIDLYGQVSIHGAFVFANQRKKVENIYRTFRDRQPDFPIEMISSDMSQEQRTKISKDFASGKIRVLVTTDIMARGIDVVGVSYVINVDIPNNIETYYQRVGRTGRLGKKGVAINFVSDKRQRDKLTQIEQYYSINVQQMPLDFSSFI